MNPFFSKKAQFIVFSAIFMLFVFFLVFTLFFNYLLSNPSFNSDFYDSLQLENSRLSSALLLPGFPVSWDLDSVQRLGLSSNGFLNLTKLYYLYLLDSTESGFDLSKSFLSITNDYLIIVDFNHVLDDDFVDFINDSFNHSLLSVNLINPLVIARPSAFNSFDDFLNNSDVGFVAFQKRILLLDYNGSLVPVSLTFYSYNFPFVVNNRKYY